MIVGARISNVVCAELEKSSASICGPHMALLFETLALISLQLLCRPPRPAKGQGQSLPIRASACLNSRSSTLWRDVTFQPPSPPPRVTDSFNLCYTGRWSSTRSTTSRQGGDWCGSCWTRATRTRPEPSSIGERARSFRRGCRNGVRLLALFEVCLLSFLSRFASVLSHRDPRVLFVLSALVLPIAETFCPSGGGLFRSCGDSTVNLLW